MGQPISEWKNKMIVDTYLSTNFTTHEVAQKVGCAQSYVLKILKLNNINRRSVYHYTRKHEINEQFFDKIDAEDKAYFLGFFYADGNNYRKDRPNGGKDYQIAMNLQARDKHILEELKNRLAPNISLKFIKRQKQHRQDQYRLKFDSKTVSDQLVALGCIPNKALILTYPSNDIVPVEFTKSFIRGYFDGDGSVSCYLNKRNLNMSYVADITSSNLFCKVVKDIITKNVDVNFSSELAHPDRNNITTRIRVGGNQQVYKFLSWLYDGSTIHLERKYNKFLELKNYLIENNLYKGIL